MTLTGIELQFHRPSVNKHSTHYANDTQHYKVRIKGKVEQSRNKSITLPYTSVL